MGTTQGGWVGLVWFGYFQFSDIALLVIISNKDLVGSIGKKFVGNCENCRKAEKTVPTNKLY
jgi:hypothetical protein